MFDKEFMDNIHAHINVTQKQINELKSRSFKSRMDKRELKEWKSYLNALIKMWYVENVRELELHAKRKREEAEARETSITHEVVKEERKSLTVVPKWFDVWYKEMEWSGEQGANARMYLLARTGWGRFLSDYSFNNDFFYGDVGKQEILDYVIKHKEELMQAVLDGEYIVEGK